ncbi:MAG: hypothetical protein ACFWT0_02005 [Bifidobacterium crudilactis]
MNQDLLIQRYREAALNNLALEGKLAHDVHSSRRSLQLDRIANSEALRIGYVVATCSPVTFAHLELAQQAADRLDLDKVLFVIWPFHYIKGFHAAPLERWVESEHHIGWDQRVELLQAAISECGDQRLEVFRDSERWYVASEDYFLEGGEHAWFWTGTWYVLRRIQAQMRSTNPNLRFVFICGADQFNPNIRALEEAEGREKVWKDYSLSEQLALHDVFAVPRSDGRNPLVEPEPTERISNRVYIGDPLHHSGISATAIRNGTLCLDELRLLTYERVIDILVGRNIWGYADQFRQSL